MKLFGFDTAMWAGLMPNGLGQIKPNHYGEMLKVIWQNRSNLPLAWRILSKGVCDGCALGTTGLKDFTLSGPHLCTVRLHLLRLNTMPAFDAPALSDVAALRKKTSKELRDLGRIPFPFMRKKGEPGFTRISWDAAYDAIAGSIQKTTPQRTAFYLTSRGITNEVYYMAQKAARFMGTNNVDNAARICHSPSTVAMKNMLGVSASTCSYKDWIGTDLLIFLGSDTPNNQPVTTKYMYHAKKHGTKIIVVNPYKEPGLERYWVPSVFESAVFGTKLADEFFEVHTGGDLAFLNGVLKAMIENNWIDRAFVQQHTNCFEDVEANLAEQDWAMLAKYSGVSQAEMTRFARMLGEAKSAVFVWSMGITQHENGVDNVKAILNLALARGFIGRDKCGTMPIRGHSGVQGGGEMGCVPWNFAGGESVHPDSAQKMGALWGFEVPAWRGMAAVEMIDAAHNGNLDVFYVAGGNFLETLPEPKYIEYALQQPKLRVHQDIVLTSQMLVDPAETVIILPAATRYEQEGGGTETSTERQVIFSPFIEKPPAEAKSEWRIFMELAERVCPAQAHLIHVDSGQQIRDEIAKAAPNYDGIQHLKKQGDHFQWGGAHLCAGGNFKTSSGRGVFTTLKPIEHRLNDGQFIVKTRRGKQFNSLVQYDRDPLNGARRDDVLMSRDDAQSLGLADGDAVRLASDLGEMRVKVKIAPIKPKNLQVHWPEGNVLIRHGMCDAEAGVPAYKAVVTIQKI